MVTPLIHFVHGKESGPWAKKITRLVEITRDRGLDVAILDYSGVDDPFVRAEKLIAACSDESRPIILVGASMGGWVATAASGEIQSTGLFLLAPAFDLPGYPKIDPGCEGKNIEVIHGWRDDVIPYENSVRFGLKHGCTVHLVDDGHRLSERLDRICEYFSCFLNRLVREV